MVVKNFHVGVGLAGMIDVVRAVAAATAIQTPAFIDRTDTQPAPVGPTIGFGLRNPLAGVLGYFPPAFEVSN